jgi:leucyl/phenylalanyl-tRNA--protein transferase
MAESKFHRADLGGSGASKVCLVALARHLDARGFLICDTQFSNEHIAQFGVHEIPRAEYLALLTRAVEAPASWAPFDPEVALKGAIRA